MAACAPGRASPSPAESRVDERLGSQSRAQVCLGGKITFLFGKSLFFLKKKYQKGLELNMEMMESVNHKN